MTYGLGALRRSRGACSFREPVMASHAQTIRLRRFDANDAARIAELVRNPCIHRMLVPIRPDYGVADAQSWLSTHDVGFANKSDLCFAIDYPSTGLIGSVGAHRRDGLFLELGYWLSPDFWGRGIATQAVGMLVKWLEDELKESAFLSSYFTDNPPSGSVLRKSGFLPSGRSVVFSQGRNGFVDSQLMARLR